MKISTNPNIIDECLCLRIGGFYPFIKQQTISDCVTTWSNGERLKSIVNSSNKDLLLCHDGREVRIPANAVALVRQTANGLQIADVILIVPRESNLKNGDIWFWECPVTRNLCRKLYLYHGRFVSRYAIPNKFYKKQVQSKHLRNLIRLVDVMDMDENFPKNAKKHYRRKPTSRWIKWNRKQERSDFFLIRYVEHDKLNLFGVKKSRKNHSRYRKK